MQIRMDQTLPGTCVWTGGNPASVTVFRSDQSKFTLAYNSDGTFVVHPSATGSGLYFVLTAPNGTQATSPTFDIVPAGPSSGTITFGTPIPA